MSVWKFCNDHLAYPQYNLLEGVLTKRGVSLHDLEPEGRESPLAVAGMKNVAGRLAQAVVDKKKVLVFGDYDCDGVCSAFLMTRFLSACGVKAVPYLPTRGEGYGINPEQVKRAADEGYDLIVTVDNGISALPAAEAANSLGIELLVTDHHEPPPTLPNVPVTDPKLPGSQSYRHYSGTGVAYLVCSAVAHLLGRHAPDEMIDLVSLATVVDVCPLTGENFRLARRGLLMMRNKLRPGLAALVKLVNAKRIDGRLLGWIIGPRINAAGRLSNPVLAYRLLAAESVQEAEQIAQELDKIKKESQNAVKTATDLCLAEYDGADFPIFASDQWQEGIVGVAAGKLVDRLLRPVAVGCRRGETVKFSARAPGDFDLVAALEECQRRTNALVKHGGHRGAAGFTLKLKDLPSVKTELTRIAKEELKPEDQAGLIEIDLRLDALPSVDQVERLDLLEPYGCSNPVPTFYLRDHAVEVKKGKGWTLVRTAAGMKFFTSEEVEEGRLVHAALNLGIDEYNGYRQIIGHAAEIRPLVCDREELRQRYLAWRRHRNIPGWAETIFRELGLEQQGENKKTSLFYSPTFLKYGFIKD